MTHQLFVFFSSSPLLSVGKIFYILYMNTVILFTIWKRRNSIRVKKEKFAFLRVGGKKTRLENNSRMYKDGAVLDEPVLSVNK